MKKLLWVACASGIGWLSAPLGMVEGQSVVDPNAPGTSAAESRPMVRPRSALQAAVELYKQAEYEQADAQLRVAEKGQLQLTEEDKALLEKYVKQNTEALLGRRAGQAQLKQAEQAVRSAQWQEADTLVKTLRTNKYLSVKDQQQVASLSEQVKQKSGKKSWEPTGKQDPDALMADAKKALEQKDWDKAIMMAQAAERAGYKAVLPWSDTPAKVIAAADAAKAKQPAAPATGDKSAQARGLLQQAHMAVQAGDTVKARRLVQQAEDMKVTLAFYEEYTPEKVKNEIVRAEGAAARQSGVQTTGAVQPAQAATAPTTSAAGNDAKAMAKEARQCLEKGDLDRAEDLAKRARLVPGTKWGLFDDTPDHVLADVLKARENHNSTRAAELLLEARRKLEANQLDEAEKLCHQAQALRSSYPLWYRGEQPDKLLKDISAKRRLASKPVLPPLPEGMGQKVAGASNPAAGATTASLPPTRAPEAPVVSPVSAPMVATAPPPPAPPTMVPALEPPASYSAPSPEPKGQQMEVAQSRKQQQAQELCVQARLCLNRGDFTAAMQFANQAKGLNLQLRVGDDSPEDIIRAVQAVQNSALQKAQQAADVLSDAKQQAQRYLAEARMFQKENRLIEALQSAQAAAKLSVSFSPNEETPEHLTAELQLSAKGQYDTYYAAAQSLMSAGKYKEAEEYLHYVEKLSVAYLMETQAVAQQLAQLKRLATAGPEHAVQLSGEGQQLLVQAMREKERGDLVQARKMAESVYTGPYGMKDQASKLLAELDDAEYKASVARAKTAYEIGRRAFIRKEYDIAASYLSNIDLKMLDEHSRQQCKEMLASRFMNPSNVEMVRPVATAAPDNVPPSQPTQQAPVGEWTQPSAAATQAPQTSSQAAKPDQPEQKKMAGSGLLDEVRTRQMIELQRLRDMKINAEKQANQLAGMNKLDDAIAVLENGVKSLKSSGLDADQIGPMQRQLESRMRQLTMMREQQELSKLADDVKNAKNQVAMRLMKADEEKKQKVGDLMKQYKTFIDQGKYTDACRVAMMAREIDPDDVSVQTAYSAAELRRAVTDDKSIKELRDRGNADMSRAVARSAIPVSTENEDHLTYPDGWRQKTRRREGKTSLPARPQSPRDREVYNRLESTVSVDFHNKPLGQVLDELHSMSQVNIVPDLQSLQTDNISLEMPVDIRLDKVRLKTALELMLKNARLTYVVNDGVLMITTPAAARGRLEQHIFPVADLIVPVENMANVADGRQKLADPNKQANEMMQGLGLGSNNVQVSYSTPPGSAGYTPGGPTPRASSGKGRQPGQTMEEQLIKLLIDTIEPQSWDVMGGSGHIEFYPLNMTLVVSQTPDIQEQIQLLLDRLRELQNLQVTVEVRFLTLQENFYESIGIDFDINILSRQRKFEREVVASAFAPAGQINAPHEHNVVVGLSQIGPENVALTQDLNIPVNASSYGMAFPTFGNFPNDPSGANGGIDLGIAFLSDIEVFMFLEAAQGDRRTSLLTAPKITLFNGQEAAITTSRTQPYVATVITIPGNFGGLPGAIPIIQNASSFTSLAVQAVVSADRRYVQLTLSPSIQRVLAINSITINNGTGINGTGTTTIQEPITDFLGLGTTVSVPDGGTILLGGFKLLNENRNEFGPPILSKIPYINRLFTNVGYGRDETSLLFMVTPHIIIPEEEEERLGQTFAF